MPNAGVIGAAVQEGVAGLVQDFARTRIVVRDAAHAGRSAAEFVEPVVGMTVRQAIERRGEIGRKRRGGGIGPRRVIGCYAAAA